MNRLLAAPLDGFSVPSEGYGKQRNKRTLLHKCYCPPGATFSNIANIGVGHV
jgi:hypothetical protein